MSETTMKKPIPSDLLAQLRSLQQWSQTQDEGGKQLEAEDLNLIEMYLSHQNLAGAQETDS